MLMFKDNVGNFDKALTLVRYFLQANPEERGGFTLSAPDYSGTLHEALNLLHNTGLRSDWLYQAHVLWMEGALTAWEDRLSQADKMKWSVYKSASDWYNFRARGMGFNMMDRMFINPKRLGRAYARIHDRWLDVLFRMYRGTEDSSFREHLIREIARRSDCEVKEEFTDTTFLELLLAKYGITLEDALPLLK